MYRFHEQETIYKALSKFPSLYLFTGPIASTLTNKYGCRIVTIAGAIIASIGFIISIPAPNIYYLYFSFGITAGKFFVRSMQFASVIKSLNVT